MSISPTHPIVIAAAAVRPIRTRPIAYATKQPAKQPKVSSTALMTIPVSMPLGPLLAIIRLIQPSSNPCPIA